MKSSFLFGVLGVVAALQAPRVGRADDVIISEVMAVNVASLADEDGEFSDWIELYNSSAQAVSLSGWSLTDDSKKLGKWKLPDASLAPGAFLVVFASEKNRTDPARPLHTNFKLDPDGEYLALVRPDGVTVASEFKAKYPLQVGDVSYGVPMETASTSLLAAGAAAKVLVPTDAGLGTAWREAVFDDSAWAAASTGIGFDKKTEPTYNELIQTNIETQMWKVSTSAYIRIPFNVADPASLGAVLLKLKYEDGLVAFVNGKEVARRNAPATLLWNSKAPARRLEKDAAVFELFNLGAYLSDIHAGANVLAIHGLNDSSTSNTADFLVLPEIEALKVLSMQAGVRQYFAVPTPGLPNAPSGFPAVTPEPEFSMPGGTYADSVSLELRADSPETVIHFTLDRTEPTEASAAYTAPLSIANTTMVRAKAFRAGQLPSPIVSSTYVLLNANVKDFTSNLPIVVIETFGRALPEDPLTLCQVNIFDNPGGRTSITGTPVVSSRAGLKKRGSSSLGFPKNHFAVEFWDERNVDQDVEVFDFPKESDYILNGPYDEKTLLRDYLAYDWSNKMGRYAVRTKLVEVYLNQSGPKIDAADYWGVYVFMEKIKRGDDRVDIKKLHASQTQEPEVSGGYILKNDRLDPGDAGLRTTHGQALAYVYPKEHEATVAQKAYIVGFLNKFETALYGADFKDPDVGYAKYIDAGSFIDQHILVEMLKNIDGYRLSTYMYKDRDGKLVMGPAWDYNLSLGNANYLDGWKPDGWYYPLIGSAQEYPWYPRLFQDPAFVQKYNARWLELRQGFVQIDKLHKQIDDLALFLDESQKRNFVKWKVLGIYVWPNQYIGQTYQDEIDFMKGWLRDRITWMDATLAPVPAPVFSQNGGAVEKGLKVTISAPNGTIYYSVNGSDPKQTDGSVSPDSQVYAAGQEITVNANTRVRARAKVSAIWSPLAEDTYVTDVPPLVITELMYNAPVPPEGSAYRQIDFKYIEIQNVGSVPFDTTGLHFSRGVVFSFTGSPVTTLAPGEIVVVVRKRAAFETRYDTTNLKIAGEWTQDLSTSGEFVTLKGALDETIVDFQYVDTWYPETDGQGYSLVLVDPKAQPSTFNAKESWRPSSEVNGSPGFEDLAPVGGLQLPGDITQDGVLNITDAVAVLRHLFQGLLVSLPCGDGTRDDPGNKMLADVDGDGSLNLTDAVGILRYLFLDGTPPALGTSCVRMPGCANVCVR